MDSLNARVMTIDTTSKELTLESLLKKIPSLIENLRDKRDTYLTDAVLMGEIPAPTFGEEERIRLVLDRFRENGLDDPEVDDFGNASGILPGAE